MKKIGGIPKVHISKIKDFDAEYLRPGRPVIIQGALEDWSASKKWNLDYFREKIGNLEVEYREGYTLKHIHHIEEGEEKTFRGPFKEFATKLETSDMKKGVGFFLKGDHVYFHNSQHDVPTNPKLAPIGVGKDFNIPKFCPKDVDSIGFWISPGGIQTWLHYDRPYNLNAQVTGQKVVRLFRPEESGKLDFLSLLTPPYYFQNSTYFDVSNPDYEAYPEAQSAEYFQETLEAGELLFIPPYWLHCFEHTGKININVNFWWQQEGLLLNPLSARDAFVDASHVALHKLGIDSPEAKMAFLNENQELAGVLLTIEKSFLG